MSTGPERDGDRLALRAMVEDDLGLVRSWLVRPHVARWYLAGSTVEAEIDDIRRSVAGAQPTEMLLMLWDEAPAGWCQWYLCGDYPEHALRVGAGASDVGIDYAIGDPALVGRRAGTALIAALVAQVRSRRPNAGFVVDPAASNTASRRVLEKNGFWFSGECPDPDTGEPDAIYRLPPAGVSHPFV